MADQITSIDFGPAWRRALLVVPVAVAAACVWFAARWCLGNELARWVPDVEGVSRASMAAAATRLAPDDPQTHFTLARLGDRSLLPEELPAAVARYEQAAALSPNDYRLWVELGRARSAAGDSDGAERALRRAIELAPNAPQAMLKTCGRKVTGSASPARRSSAKASSVRPARSSMLPRYQRGPG